ncbi:hypothetical protein FOA52_015974 [Chlamydomonas sp. UWO 241]|nr:hypothetical protein FOA52_015974 [Chlamydomonas sp. UWO 241]
MGFLDGLKAGWNGMVGKLPSLRNSTEPAASARASPRLLFCREDATEQRDQGVEEPLKLPVIAKTKSGRRVQFDTPPTPPSLSDRGSIRNDNDDDSSARVKAAAAEDEEEEERYHYLRDDARSDDSATDLDRSRSDASGRSPDKACARARHAAAARASSDRARRSDGSEDEGEGEDELASLPSPHAPRRRPSGSANSDRSDRSGGGSSRSSARGHGTPPTARPGSRAGGARGRGSGSPTRSPAKGVEPVPPRGAKPGAGSRGPRARKLSDDDNSAPRPSLSLSPRSSGALQHPTADEADVVVEEPRRRGHAAAAQQQRGAAVSPTKWEAARARGLLGRSSYYSDEERSDHSSDGERRSDGGRSDGGRSDGSGGGRAYGSSKANEHDGEESDHQDDDADHQDRGDAEEEEEEEGSGDNMTYNARGDSCFSSPAKSQRPHRSASEDPYETRPSSMASNNRRTARPPSGGSIASAESKRPASRMQTHAQAIITQHSDDHLSYCAVRLDWLLSTFMGQHPEVSSQQMATGQVVQRIIKPATAAGRTRYVQMLAQSEPDTVSRGRPYFYVSQTWSQPFVDMIGQLRSHFSAEQQKVWRRGKTAMSSSQVFVWLDCFAVNQHPGAETMGDLKSRKEVVADAEQVWVGTCCFCLSRSTKAH